MYAMYRDEYERCPRCQVELTDAGAVRSCGACRGQWASASTLLDMAQTMTHPNPLPPLQFAAHDRAKLACPSCQDGMTTLRAGKIEIDRCDKHGYWFDRDELQQILMAVFELEQQTRV